jgi:hypothetical protein
VKISGPWVPSPALAAFQAFAEIARGYCAWCERTSQSSTADAQAASWLGRLYAAALELPEVDPQNTNAVPNIPADFLERATSELARFNGMYYRKCFDPAPGLDEGPVMGDVGDDLLDIYKDVKAGLLLFDGGATTEAVWHWAFMHRIHWGHHAVGALYALHCLSISKQE